ncbi:MAG TPA: glycosyltransferase family 2 protein [Alphaproteobacteria bacterium]|nr:glycosyltransferase family 2 protein [Alphaproteobacteria bacterium]
MELSVVIPVLNEAGNVGPLLAEIRAALDGRFDYEVIVVDDGSSDATPDELKAQRAGFPRLRVIRHRAACGQSAALRSGVHAARGRFIATLDGDGQNDPADIPRLWQVLQQQGDAAGRTLVNGHRQKRQDTAIRRLSSRIANRVRSRLLRDDTPDSGCGLKLYARALYLGLPYFDHMHRFMPALVRREGGAVLSVPVNHRPRHAGRSKYGIGNRLWVGIVDLMGVRWLQSRAHRPAAAELPAPAPQAGEQ